MCGAAGARPPTGEARVGLAPLNPTVRPSALAVATGGLCPRCGERTLFAGPLAFASACAACGLEFARFNVGDGPAAFVTAIGGAVVVVLAVATELIWQPPLWLHAVLWLPLTLLLVIGGLRITKAWLLASEVWRDAREGRLR